MTALEHLSQILIKSVPCDLPAIKIVLFQLFSKSRYTH